MSDILINKARACAVTGHRALKEDFDREKLKNLFLRAIDYGYDTFLVGMAIGFDMLCFSILEEIRKKKNIAIIACVPCRNQSERYPFIKKLEYKRMLKSADYVNVLSEEYTSRCMQDRNEYMVDNASLLIAHLYQERGGTFNTVRYAKKKGIKIAYI